MFDSSSRITFARKPVLNSSMLHIEACPKWTKNACKPLHLYKIVWYIKLEHVHVRLLENKDAYLALFWPWSSDFTLWILACCTHTLEATRAGNQRILDQPSLYPTTEAHNRGGGHTYAALDRVMPSVVLVWLQRFETRECVVWGVPTPVVNMLWSPCRCYYSVRACANVCVRVSVCAWVCVRMCVWYRERDSG